METVTVRIPASTSNLGPGFDCLGVALRIYNDVTVRRGGRGEQAEMVRACADAFFRTTGSRPFGFSCNVTGDVPISRGLGSSVTVRLGLMHGLSLLTDRPLSRDQIFRLCAELEGHPDNAAPAQFGGFNVARGLEQRQRFTVSSALKFILLVPDFEVRTLEARALLPNELNRKKAVESCGNACMITAAFASGKYEKLRGAFGDHLHQPFRKKLIPFLDDVLAAATKAGALGGFLSGSGSTIATVTLRNAEEVAAAILEASPNDARVFITTADNRGARLTNVSRS